MKYLKWLFLMACLTFFGATSVQAGTPVWRISKGDHHLFIGGTVHVLTSSDFPLPPAFEQAYGQSSILVFETDMRKLQTPEFQKALMDKAMYHDGRSLKTVLKPTTYQQLEKYLTGRGMPMTIIEKFKPGMAAMTLTVIELQRLGLAGTGVDQFLSLRAINDKKALGQLETPEEQLAFIVSLGEGREDAFVLYTLRDIAELPERMQSIKDAWRDGDNAKLEKVSLAPFRKDFPRIYNQIIVKRNTSWMPKIEAMLKTDPVEMILVGAMHMVGTDGILERLKADGCQVQMLD